jgi:hypothetical protein
MHDGERKEDEK